MTSTYRFRLPIFAVTLAALALCLLAFAASTGAAPSSDRPTPNLGTCQDLAAPAGNKVAFHVYAEGVQIYRWSSTGWSFVGPDAVLYANAGSDGVVGSHYAGPTWESVSGSKVGARVVRSCTADPDAIPWLLLQAVSSSGPGVFDGVTFIQRVNTTGGKAPSSAGNFPNQEARVPYTAEYFFYRAQD